MAVHVYHELALCLVCLQVATTSFRGSSLLQLIIKPHSLPIASISVTQSVLFKLDQSWWVQQCVQNLATSFKDHFYVMQKVWRAYFKKIVNGYEMIFSCVTSHWQLACKLHCRSSASVIVPAATILWPCQQCQTGTAQGNHSHVLYHTLCSQDIFCEENFITVCGP